VRYLLLILLTFSFAVSAKVRCWSCTAGTSDYDVPVLGYPGVSKDTIAKSAVRNCRIIIDSWNEDPNQCKLKSCEPRKICGGEGGYSYCDDHPSSPNCDPSNDYCSKNPGSEECQNPNYCVFHPDDPGCKLP
jgi:hypothetical protein